MCAEQGLDSASASILRGLHNFEHFMLAAAQAHCSLCLLRRSVCMRADSPGSNKSWCEAARKPQEQSVKTVYSCCRSAVSFSAGVLAVLVVYTFFGHIVYLMLGPSIYLM